ncbi:MAG: ABC transporter ATP-binding protein [Deltaproteobacteria bacterium]|nr:ABC transporter ATP-binding protein [Deltaproteobacteria bacterium]
MIGIEGVEKSYGENRILKDLNLFVPSGKFLSIMGRSGSGKSTLLNLVGGMDRPDRGRIIIGNEEISGYSEERLTLYRRKRVGYVFQFFNLLPNLTAQENIEMPLLLNGVSGYEGKIIDLMDSLGLGGKESSYPHQLSGGEQQRVAICRALIHDPDIILADEPTGNLDSNTGHVILALLREMCEKRGKTLLLVTHDLAVAQYGEEILKLRDGKLG